MTLYSLAAFETLLALTALQRLFELGLSRAHMRRASGACRAADSTANWAALVALQSTWLAGSALEPLARERLAPPVLFGAGLALFAAGALLRVWCIRSLGPSWNARGSVDPELRVVSSGPYRWLRHPNYLGVLLELVGLPLAGGAWITLAALAPLHAAVLVRRIRGEDALLFALPGYADTMAGKGALFPRFGPRSDDPERRTGRTSGG